jgi:hypothetical protein
MDNGTASRQSASFNRAGASHQRKSAGQQTGKSGGDECQRSYVFAQADLPRLENLLELWTVIHCKSTQTQAPKVLLSNMRSSDASQRNQVVPQIPEIIGKAIMEAA